MSESFSDKYAPLKISDIVVNKENVLKIVKWLEDFDKNKIISKYNKGVKNKEKKPLSSTANVIIIGTHGIGKTCAAKVVLEEMGYNIIKPIFNNAKITKNIKSSIKRMLCLNNISNLIDGTGSNMKNVVLVDELESVMASNDKKYLSEMHKLNNSSWICPIIFIANSKHNKLVTDIKKSSNIIYFNPPTDYELETILNLVKTKEELKIQSNARLINHCQQDIRRLLCITQDLKEIYGGNKLISDSIVNQYCDTSKKKDVDIVLFKATENILLRYNNINDCLRFYEMEKTLLPLMIHQNYINCVVKKKGSISEKYRVVNKISKSLSFGDVIDNYIYSDQNWNLQELHGLYTCTMPSYYLHDSKLSGNLVNVRFATDLNKTSIKRINKKNIVTSNKMFTNMNVSDYIYLSKIIKKLLDENDIPKCIELLKNYKIELSNIELLLKIDKINGKTSLTPRQKKEFEKYLGKINFVDE